MTDPTEQELSDFANAVLGDWDAAMDRFFQVVDRQREDCGLTEPDAFKMLNIGYGPEVAEHWCAWYEEGHL